MQTLLISAILILFLVVVFQIAKASEYVAMIRGYENARKQSNKINALFVAGIFGIGIDCAFTIVTKC